GSSPPLASNAIPAGGVAPTAAALAQLGPMQKVKMDAIPPFGGSQHSIPNESPPTPPFDRTPQPQHVFANNTNINNSSSHHHGSGKLGPDGANPFAPEAPTTPRRTSSGTGLNGLDRTS